MSTCNLQNSTNTIVLHVLNILNVLNILHAQVDKTMPHDDLICNHWSVVTTIFEPSEAVIRQAKLEGKSKSKSK